MIIIDAYVAITLLVLVSVAALAAVALLSVPAARWLRRAVKARHETSVTGPVALAS